jgi:predicted RNA-binding Zn ribbon-like protein
VWARQSADRQAYPSVGEDREEPHLAASGETRGRAPRPGGGSGGPARSLVSQGRVIPQGRASAGREAVRPSTEGCRSRVSRSLRTTSAISADEACACRAMFASASLSTATTSSAMVYGTSVSSSPSTSRDGVNPGTGTASSAWARRPKIVDRMIYPLGRFRVRNEAMRALQRHSRREQPADTRCTRLFVDRSRSGSHRWCDKPTCGGRADAAAYRRRRAQHPPR